jgi:hypothetical protein
MPQIEAADIQYAGYPLIKLSRRGFRPAQDISQGPADRKPRRQTVSRSLGNQLDLTP